MDLETFLTTLASSDDEIDRLLLSLIYQDIRKRGPAWRKLLHLQTSEVEKRLLALLRASGCTRGPFAHDEALVDEWSLRSIIQNLFCQRGRRAQPALLDALHDPIPLVKETAVCTLGALGNPETFPAVFQVLIDDPQLEQYHLYVIEALASLSAPQHLDLLIPILMHGNDEQRRVTAVCIEHIGPPAVPVMLPLLAHQNTEVRSISAALLGTLCDPQVIDALIATLNDSVASVRCQAIQALHQLQAQQAIPAFNEAMNDVSYEVREAAMLALAQLDETHAFETYSAALHDPDPDIRSQAASWLGHLKDPRVAELLFTALRDPGEWVRRNALSALAELGDERVLEPLLAALADPAWRELAASGLGNLGDPRAVEPLLVAFADSQEGTPLEQDYLDGQLAFDFHDSQGWIRDSIIIALSNIGDPRATETLITALDDPGYFIQISARRGLGKLGDQRAVAPLLKLLHEKNDSSVAQPLVELGGSQAIEGLYGVLLERQRYPAYVYYDVARALRIRQQPAPAVLFTRLRHAETPEERQTTALILGALGDPQAFSALLTVIHDTQEDLLIRNAAVCALGELDGEQAREPLISLLASDSTSLLRAQAAYVLGELNQPAALIPLLNALDDQAPLVRALAARSLGNFHDPRVLPALHTMIAREITLEVDFDDYAIGISSFPSHVAFADTLPEEYAERAIRQHQLTSLSEAVDRKIIIFRRDSTGLQMPATD